MVSASFGSGTAAAGGDFHFGVGVPVPDAAVSALAGVGVAALVDFGLASVFQRRVLAQRAREGGGRDHRRTSSELSPQIFALATGCCTPMRSGIQEFRKRFWTE